MKYSTVNETAARWGISPRRVRVILNSGRVAGAIKVGRDWVVPSDAKQPVDARAGK